MHWMGLISDQASFLTPSFPCRSNQPQQDKGCENLFFKCEAKATPRDKELYRKVMA
ncbi:hypothetical protein GLYMA_16G039100v4 [Glycine max]|uniref:Uncharacterized protein n=2 Tax=Glycine subgen. Soja TaxID=1462606 RepID=A0A0R0FV25_SOYBN|nr:hypothetical protein JHK87_044159 [Glycine soja]KRH06680.1 hypothetical protein GLYMA_16G039100v4 [Glycine max]RZB59482.1 hypothetical protein D0Y65_042632 [Glycine soja]